MDEDDRLDAGSEGVGMTEHGSAMLPNGFEVLMGISDHGILPDDFKALIAAISGGTAEEDVSSGSPPMPVTVGSSTDNAPQIQPGGYLHLVDTNDLEPGEALKIDLGWTAARKLV